jgi:hypothetical protein
MKPASLFLWFAIGLSLSLVLIVHRAYPHGGGLDADGCHHNRKLGGYHCHRGPLAGQSFASKEKMLERLKSKGDKASQPSPAEKTRRQLSP